MESTDSVGRIQVPEEVYQRLKNDFVLQERGVVEVKGKGVMRTWYLIGRKPDTGSGGVRAEAPQAAARLTRPANLPPSSPIVGKFSHGNHCCPKAVAASVEVDSGIRDSGAGPRHPGVGVARRIHPGRRLPLRHLSADHRYRASCSLRSACTSPPAGGCCCSSAAPRRWYWRCCASASFGEGYAILLLAIWIGVGFIFRGVATAVSAISDPALPGRGWQIFLGAISLLAGLVMIGSPFESWRILTLIVGIWLIVIGAFEIMSSFAIRSASKRVGKALTGGSPRPDRDRHDNSVASITTIYYTTS